MSGIAWCQGEPNNKDGKEHCANLLTGCASGAAAVANDMACERRLRVLCAHADTSCGAGRSMRAALAENHAMAECCVGLESHQRLCRRAAERPSIVWVKLLTQVLAHGTMNYHCRPRLQEGHHHRPTQPVSRSR